MTTIALNNLWNYIDGLSLKKKDREWLAGKLIEPKAGETKKADPTLMTKEEFFARVDEAEKEIAEGKGTTFTNLEEMNAWLNSL